MKGGPGTLSRSAAATVSTACASRASLCTGAGAQRRARERRRREHQLYVALVSDILGFSRLFDGPREKKKIGFGANNQSYIPT